MAERQAPWLQIAKILVAIAVAWFASLQLLAQQQLPTCCRRARSWCWA